MSYCPCHGLAGKFTCITCTAGKPHPGPICMQAAGEFACSFK